jgi:hypothetical protein
MTNFYNFTAGILTAKRCFALFLSFMITGWLPVMGQEKPITTTRTVCASGCDFPSIQAAIDAASENDVIEVSAGTYAEQLYVWKPLTLRGPNAGIEGNATRLTEAVLTYPTPLPADSWYYVLYAHANNVTVDGFEIRDQPDALRTLQPFLIYTDAVNDFTLRNNRILGADLQLYVGTSGGQNVYRTGLMVERNYFDGGPFVNSVYHRAMYIQGTSGTIQDNVIKNASIGIQYMPYHHTTSGLIQRNTISAGLVGLYHNYQNLGAAPVTYQDNVVTVSPNDQQGDKLLVNTPWDTTVVWRGIHVITHGIQNTGNLPEVTFLNNKVDGALDPNETYNSTARDAFRISNGKSGSVTLLENSFENYTTGVMYVEDCAGDCEAIVNATCNWWGSSNFNTVTTAAGPATFLPYIADDTDNDPAIGFQPVPNSCTGGPVRVYTDATETTLVSAHLTIQSAIDAATTLNGYVVRVDAGTYEELVTVSKELSLLGPNAAIAGNGARVAEAIIEFPAGGANLTNLINIGPGLNNVTLAGFDIRIPDALQTGTDQYRNLIVSNKDQINGCNNLTIRNNRMYSGAVSIYVITKNTQTEYRTGLLIEGNYIDGGPWVNSWTNRGLYIQSTSGTIQDNVIVNTSIGIQYMPYKHTTPALIRRNTVSSSVSPIYHNYQTKGAALVTYEENVLSPAPNPQTGLLTQVYGPWTDFPPIPQYAGFYVRTMGTEQTGAAPTVLFRNNTVLATNPGGTNTVVFQAVRVRDAAADATVNLQDNSFVDYTTGVVRENAPTTVVNATCNWWGSDDVATVSAAAGTANSFLPYLTNGTDNDAAIGFQPVPNSCNGGPVRVYTDATETTLVSAHLTIQAAINDTSTLDGYVIQVAAGVYAEQSGGGTALLVNKSVIIKGAGIATYDGSGNWTGGTLITRGAGAGGQALNQVVEVSANGVTISGLTVDGRYGFGPGTTTNYGMFISGDNCTLQNLRVLDPTNHAIELNGADNAIVTNVHVEKTGFSPYAAEFLAGLRIVASLNASVSNFSATNVRRGIMVWQQDASATLSNITIVGNANPTVSSGFTFFTQDQPNWWQSDFGVYQGVITVQLGGAINVSNTAFGIDILDLVVGQEITVTTLPAATFNFINNVANGARVNGVGSVNPVPAPTIDAVMASMGLTQKITGPPALYNYPTPVRVYSDSAETNLVSGHSTIQAAINDTSTLDGYVVRVEAGTYNEFVDVSKELSIRGANYGVDPNTGSRGAESIISYDGDYAVEIFASNASFDGFSVSNTLGNAVRISVGRQNPGSTANVSNVTVSNNIATGAEILSCPSCTGLYMGVLSFDNFEQAQYTSSGIAFTNNRLTVSGSNGRGITMSAYNGSQLTGAISISGNHILSDTSLVGIELLSTSGLTSMQNVAISGNTISGFGIGVLPRLQSTASISGNTFVGNLHDIRLDHDPANNKNVIGANTFSGSTSAIWNNTTADIDISTTAAGSTFGGITLDGSTSLANLFAIEDKIRHKVDVGTLGFVRVKAGHVFVTPNSFVASGTTSPSIQRGVDAATAGDIIEVDAGTYAENININKADLILKSSVEHGAKIKSASGNNVTINAGGVTFDGFLLDGEDRKDAFAALQLSGQGATIKNNAFLGNSPKAGKDTTVSAAQGILFSGSNDNATIQDNYFFSWLTGIFNQASTGGNIISNTFENVRSSAANDNVVNYTYSNNNFLDCWNGISESGATGTLTIIGNIFKGLNNAPIIIRGTATTRINSNSFTHAGNFPVVNNLRKPMVAVDATCNWWGQTTGPNSSQFSGIVTTVPFLTDGTDNDLSIAGFQPAPNSCLGGPVKVYGDSTTTTVQSVHATIQAAIDAATTISSNVIRVDAGTYTGNITITKSLTIQGPNAAIAGNGTRVPEAVIEGVFLVNANNVTIKGLSIDGTKVDQEPSLSKRGILVGNTTSQSDVTIQNNIIKEWATGISLAGGNTPGWVNNVSITGNAIVNNGIGSTENATNLTIQNNTFDNGGIGLGGGATLANPISGNTFRNATGRYVSAASVVNVDFSSIFSSNTFDKAAYLNNASGQWYNRAIFSTISGAIAVAADSATIEVAAGTYNETVNISKGVKLKSIAMPSTDAIIKGGGGSDQGDPVVRFTANNASLEGFTIDRNNSASDNRAIAPMSSSGTLIKGNKIVNAFRGIQGDFYGKPTNLKIEGNTFESSVKYGISGTEDMSGLSISGNTFNTSEEGIGLGAGAGIASGTELKTMRDAQTWILSGGYAIRDYRTNEVYVKGGTIQNAINHSNTVVGDTIIVAAGIYDEVVDINKANLELKADGAAIIKGIGTNNPDAISVRFSANGVTLRGFTVDNSNVGNANNRAIAPQGTSGATIVNNTIVNASRGIQGDFYGSPSNLKIEGNKFESTVNFGIAGTENMANLKVTENDFNNPTEFIGFGSGLSLENNQIIKNRFLGTGKLVNYTALLIDAKENYWGSANPDINSKIQGNFITCPYYEDSDFTGLVSGVGTINYAGIPKIDTVCQGTTININFPSDPPNVTYSWTNTNPLIGLSASGLGNISFSTTNNTSDAQSGLIKVLPQKGSCVGTLDSFQIIVACVQIAGKVDWHRTGTGLTGVKIKRTGDVTDETTTNSSALYNFSNTEGITFNIVPDTFGAGSYSATNLPNFGIDINDLTLINRYVNGETNVLTGYDLIAADVNDNKLVTAADAIILQFALAGNPLAIALLNDNPWTFVNANQSLNPSNPWNYNDTISIINKNGPINNQNFLGIRKGDVIGTGGSLNYSGSPGSREERTVLQLGASPNITLALKPNSLLADCGSQITLDLVLESLSSGESINVFTLDAGILWDPTKFSFADTLRKNYSSGNARISVAESAGEVLFNWFENTNINGGFFKPGDTLLTLKLNVLTAPGSSQITLGRTNATNPPGAPSYLIGPSHTDLFNEKVPLIIPASITLNPSYNITSVTGNNSVICISESNFTFTPIVSLASTPPDSFKIVFDDPSVAAGFSSTLEGSWNGTSPISIPFPVDFISGNYSFTVQVGKEKCFSNPFTVNFKVEQSGIPTISGVEDVCLGTAQNASISVSPSAPLSGSYTYEWTLSNTSLVSSTSNFDFTIPEPGTYEITGKVTTPGCGIKEVKKTFAVKPIPSVTYPSAGSTISLCNSNEIVVAFQSSVPGSNFNWTAAPMPGQGSTQIPASGSGVIKFSANYVDSAEITVTPVANGCTGSPVKFKLIVKAGSLQTINFEINVDTLCTNSAPVPLSVGSFGGLGVVGATFDPAFAGPGKHFISYSISSGECTTTKVDSIVVLPQPVAMISAADTTVCYDGSGSFSITGTEGARAWYTLNGQINSVIIPAVIPVSNLISPVKLKLDSVLLEESFTCPRFYNDSITINPRPALTTPPTFALANLNYCIGDIVVINVSNGVPNTRVFFHLTGESAQAINLDGNGSATLSISNLTQTTVLTLDSVNFRNEPICPVSFTGVNLTIPISKIPVVGTVNTISICSNEAFNVNLNDYITNLSEVTPEYTWIASLIDGITGITLSGSGNSISQTLISTAGETKIVEYVVTAKNSLAPTCPGTTFTVRVRVLPTPNPKTVVENQNLCPEENIDIKLTDLYGLEGIVTYAWARNTVTGITGLESGTGDISGPFTRSSSTSANLTFTITAKPNNACQSSVITQNITLLSDDQCVDCSQLAENIVLENIEIDKDTTISASVSITSRSIIEDANTVVFRAGSTITLLPGFEVASGSTFTAKIIGCAPTITPIAPEGNLNFAFLPSLPSQTDFEVYPNPANDWLNIEIYNSEESVGMITIFDFKGSFIRNIVRNETLPKGPVKLQADLMQLKPGIYFVTYTTNSIRLAKKLIIAR